MYFVPAEALARLASCSFARGPAVWFPTAWLATWPRGPCAVHLEVVSTVSDQKHLVVAVNSYSLIDGVSKEVLNSACDRRLMIFHAPSSSMINIITIVFTCLHALSICGFIQLSILR